MRSSLRQTRPSDQATLRLNRSGIEFSVQQSVFTDGILRLLSVFLAFFFEHDRDRISLCGKAAPIQRLSMHGSPCLSFLVGLEGLPLGAPM